MTISIDPTIAAQIDASRVPKIEQMRAIVSALPVDARVAYAPTFATIRNLADYGDWEAAAAAIAAIDVPVELADVKSQLLAIAEGAQSAI